MISKLLSALKSIKHQGLPLPHAYDPVPKQPSFRLLAAYISWVTALVAVILLVAKDREIGAYTAIGLYVLSMLFYMLKTLKKASIDVDDRSISLESAENSEKNT